MVNLISFEGCIGAGKTTLTNYFSKKLNLYKVLEESDKNLFINKFYKDANVNLETEINFLLIHYFQLKQLLTKNDKYTVLADFSIEKDIAYAKLNLKPNELEVFINLYNYFIKQLSTINNIVIYIDLSLETLKKRIFQRGRHYEMNIKPSYIKKYNEKIKEYYKEHSKNDVYFFNVDDLELEPSNKKLKKIKNLILKLI